MEIVAALNSGDPAKFLSCIPVHQVREHWNVIYVRMYIFYFQDGSCNGLQHYSALGRDLLGGRKVFHVLHVCGLLI